MTQETLTKNQESQQTKQNNPLDLTNKVIIVTGSTRGIGLKIAQTLASQGATIVCTGRKQETAENIASEINKEFNVPTLGIASDISSKESIDQLISKTIETFNQIDVLINNAGITQDNLLLRMKSEEWDSVIDTNLSSVFHSTKAVLRPMMKKKYGKIINITSVVGIMGNAGQSNYAAAKAGIIGFTKSVAKEMGPKGITCNSVAPGFIETDMIKSLPEDYLNNIKNNVPLKRLGRPEDIANLVLFLASDMSNYITGKVLSVDGGIYM